MATYKQSNKPNDLTPAIIMKLIFTVSLLLFMLTQSKAQNNEYKTFLQSRLKLNEKEIISKKLHIKDNDNPDFWKLYNRYETETAELNEVWFNQVRNYIYSSDEFTNANAEAIMDTVLRNEVHLAMLKVKYANEFTRVINERQTFLLFQINSRIRNQVTDSISVMLPLVEIQKN